jgi:group II intron reverse transcriptase/maturase
MNKRVTGKREERPKQSKSEADGICLSSESEKQPFTADKGNVEPKYASLMQEVLRRKNLRKALKKVRKNKGSEGVDGMTVEQLPDYLKKHWPTIKQQLLSGTYAPKPVRVVTIPKPSGGQRLLGIPTVLDRQIQQAISQVLHPIFDPGFSPSSYGFRPGRSAHQALNKAKEYINQGYIWNVGLDLEQFFDRVNHDILMSRVARKVQDKCLLKLIRSYLNSGLMEGGLVSQRMQGVPQGGPLSPLLSNILLDDLDKELERRGHQFCRYADDVNIYVRSRKAGQRVMESTTKFLEKKLKLRVNRDKSAVGQAHERSFLGFTFTNETKPRLVPAKGSIKRVKDRVREMTKSGRGQNIKRVIMKLNEYLKGWIGYYRLTEVLWPLKALDKWIRRRLRKILWIQWKRPQTRVKKLISYGVEPTAAKRGAYVRCGPWRATATPAMHAAISNKRLSDWGLIGLLPKQCLLPMVT